MTPQQRATVDSLRGGGFVSAQSEYVKDYAAAGEGPLYFKNDKGIAVKVNLEGKLEPAGLPLKLANSPTRVNDFIVEDEASKPAQQPPKPPGKLPSKIIKPVGIGPRDGAALISRPPIGDFIIAEDEVQEEEMKLPVEAVAEAGRPNDANASDIKDLINNNAQIVAPTIDVNGNQIVGGPIPQQKMSEMTFAQRVQEFILSGYTALTKAEEQQYGSDAVGMLLKGTDGIIVHISMDGDYKQIGQIPVVQKPREIAIGGTCNQNKKAQQLLDAGFTNVQEFFEIPNSPPNMPTHYMAPNGRIVAVNPKGQVTRPGKQTKPFPDGFFKYADDNYNEPIDEEAEAKKAQIEQIQKAIEEKKKNPPPEAKIEYRPPAKAENPKKTVKAAMDLLLKLGGAIKGCCF